MTLATFATREVVEVLMCPVGTPHTPVYRDATSTAGVSPPISTAPQTVELSIVVPLFDEQDNVELLLQRLEGVLTDMRVAFEILVVDDGSRDHTWSEVMRLARVYPGIRGIRLSRNFGHQHAILAGLAYARGAAVVTMDGDLQHPPEVVPALHREWRAGYRIVRTARDDDGVVSPFKRISSRWFYRAFSSLAEIRIERGTSDFRLIDRTVLVDVLRFNDKDLFLRGIVEWLGHDVTTVHFRAEKRHAGQSKYPLHEMLRFASGAVVSFSTRPLRLGIWMGLLTSVAALLELVYVIVQYTRGNTVPGWASVVGVTSVLFAVLFFVLGILGVYVARIHEMLQDRPKYVIADVTWPRDTAAPPAH